MGPELFSVLNNPPFQENPFNRRLAYHSDFAFKVNDTFRFPTGSRNTEVNYCRKKSRKTAGRVKGGGRSVLVRPLVDSRLQ